MIRALHVLLKWASGNQESTDNVCEVTTAGYNYTEQGTVDPNPTQILLCTHPQTDQLIDAIHHHWDELKLPH